MSETTTWKYPRQKKFEETLRNAAAAWFDKKNFKPHDTMAYCLDSYDNWTRNIILPRVAEYITKCRTEAKSKNPFPLHKYIHHGLSSQAMVFNLLGPLFEKEDFALLSEILRSNGITNTSVRRAEFEFDDREVFKESYGQPTSLDVALFGEDDKPVAFIESKLVEKEFGGCSVFAGGDCAGQNPATNLSECYLHVIGRRYWELMQNHGILSQIANERICPFTSYYQFFREILFSIERNAPFVLLCDERSAVFQVSPDRGLIPFLKSFLPDTLKSKIHVLTIQNVVKCIRNSGKHEDWIGEFEEKYGLGVVSNSAN